MGGEIPKNWGWTWPRPFILGIPHAPPEGFTLHKTMTIRATLDEGPSPGTNEFKQSYWSKALNWFQGL
jgi:hypothetical protein